MDIAEARGFIHNRFQELAEGEWWHQDNEETYQELFNVLTAYMKPVLAVSILQAAFWAAADEYGD